MKSLSVLALTLCFALIAGGAPPAAHAGGNGAHNSRNSLDWAGVYEGVIPCADCPGIRTRLTLRKDGSYELSSEYLERQVAPRIERGKFTWQPGGNAIKLDAESANQLIAVGEGRVALLPADAEPRWPQQPSRYVLERVASSGKKQATRRTLETHRWALVAATDAQGGSVDALGAEPKRPIVLHFANGRVAIEGGCNRGSGSYRIDAEGRLVVGRIASTMMACDPALMKVDDQLAALLAQPMRIELTPGPQPRLRLVSAKSGTLELAGTPTPEARYGAPTRVFLEVAAQPVACNNPLTGATSCLSVRERVYDNKGLQVGTPGEWHALYAPIEGYTHQPGVRNVLRIKRFRDKASGATHDVLDMVVESETVAR